MTAENDQFAIFEEIVRGRHSVRAFRPDAVPQQVMERIFEVAQCAPSNCNTQPWQVHVVSGQLCDELRAELPKAMESGVFQLDFPYDGMYDGVYRQRQVDAAQQLYKAMGIAREDKAGRQHAFMRNFSFFDAPHVAFLFLPEPFGLREAADLGHYAQTLMLALQAHGLASCPQTALSFQADLVRDKLSIPARHKLLYGISFGYAQNDAPANDARTGRARLSDVVNFHGQDEAYER